MSELFLRKVKGTLPVSSQDSLFQTPFEREGMPAFRGWRLKYTGSNSIIKLKHVGWHDTDDNLITATVFSGTDLTNAQTITSAYDPASTTHWSGNASYNAIGIIASTPIKISRLTIAKTEAYNYHTAEIQVSMDTTDGYDGRWYPIKAIIEPFPSGVVYKEIPIRAYTAKGFRLEGMSDQSGNVAALSTMEGKNSDIDDASHGMVEFATLADINTYKYCFTEPTLFKDAATGNVYAWTPSLLYTQNSHLDLIT